MLTKNFRAWVWIEGIGNLPGAFDTHSGVEVDSEENKYRTGDADWISLGGASEPSNITVTRLFQLRRDWPLTPALSNPGRRPMIVYLQPLDEDEHAWGRVLYAAGSFKRYKGPETDSNARSDPAMMELEQTTVTVGLA